MDETLVIVGLCLLIPSIIVVLGFTIYEAVEIFKESLMSGLVFIVLVMACVDNVFNFCNSLKIIVDKWSELRYNIVIK